MTLKTLGLNIKSIRSDLGFSQAELARMTKITPAAICMIEQGNRNPNILTLSKIALSLQASLDRLVFGDGQKTRDFRKTKGRKAN